MEIKIGIVKGSVDHSILPGHGLYRIQEGFTVVPSPFFLPLCSFRRVWPEIRPDFLTGVVNIRKVGLMSFWVFP